MMKTLPSPLPGCLFPRCLLPLNQGRDLGWDLDRETVPGWNACRMKVATTEQPGIPYEGKVNTCHGLDLVGHMPHIQGAPRTRAPSSNSQKMDMKQRHVLTHFCRSEGALLVRLRNIPTDEIPIWSQGTPVQRALLEPQISRTTKWQQFHSVLPPNPKAEKWYNQKQVSSYHLNFMAVYTCVLCILRRRTTALSVNNPAETHQQPFHQPLYSPFERRIAKNVWTL